MSETEDYDKSATPTAHKTSHQDGGSDEISLTGLAGGEITLTPKTSSGGPEGTIFYCSSDNYVYVGVE